MHWRYCLKAGPSGWLILWERFSLMEIKWLLKQDQHCHKSLLAFLALCLILVSGSTVNSLWEALISLVSHLRSLIHITYMSLFLYFLSIHPLNSLSGWLAKCFSKYLIFSGSVYYGPGVSASGQGLILAFVLWDCQLQIDKTDSAVACAATALFGLQCGSTSIHFHGCQYINSLLNVAIETCSWSQRQEYVFHASQIH